MADKRAHSEIDAYRLGVLEHPRSCAFTQRYLVVLLVQQVDLHALEVDPAQLGRRARFSCLRRVRRRVESGVTAVP